jgi:hypothetical protein
MPDAAVPREVTHNSPKDIRLLSKVVRYVCVVVSYVFNLPR